MYGTIGHLHVKSGYEKSLINYYDEFANRPGVVTISIYNMDDSARDYYLTIIWENKAAHDSIVASPEFPALYDQLLVMLEGDAEWHSGECVYSKT